MRCSSTPDTNSLRRAGLIFSFRTSMILVRLSFPDGSRVAILSVVFFINTRGVVYRVDCAVGIVPSTV